MSILGPTCGNIKRRLKAWRTLTTPSIAVRQSSTSSPTVTDNSSLVLDCLHHQIRERNSNISTTEQHADMRASGAHIINAIRCSALVTPPLETSYLYRHTHVHKHVCLRRSRSFWDRNFQQAELQILARWQSIARAAQVPNPPLDLSADEYDR